VLGRDHTRPTPAITDLIDGAYNGGTVWDDTYVPSDWNNGFNQAYQTLYTGVVRPYCRGCHVSAAPGLDLATFDQLPAPSLIAGVACQPGPPNGYFMPNAEQSMRRFWASGARAFLNEWTGDATGCNPP
jgi:hypothetical protein